MTSSKHIGYVSDIHMDELCDLKRIRDEESRDSFVRELAEKIVESADYAVLFGGDYSDDYHLLKVFVEHLDRERRHVNPDLLLIFIMGNHETGGYGDVSAENVSSLLQKHHMIVLQDAILITKRNRKISVIPGRLYCAVSFLFRRRIAKAEMVVFGADGSSLDDHWEYTCRKLYDIPEKEHIIFLTHFRIAESARQDNSVYVWGHDSILEHTDDGRRRYFADNQWRSMSIYQLKTFTIYE